MRGCRVFVTGGSGVIGMELVPRLVALGADVLVADLKQQPTLYSGVVRYRQGDLNDLTVAELTAFDPEFVIHLAATFERSTETIGFWVENFQHNVKLSHHLMTIAQHCINLRRVVFASSYLIYDQSLYQHDEPQLNSSKLNENDPIRPRNLTGMAKLAHEQELQFLEGFKEVRFSTLCVRIFRGYGCFSRDIISRWIRSLIKYETITVYRPEGYFDYIYAADSAEGLLKLTVCDKARGVVNLGTGTSRRVSEVVDVLRKHFPGASVELENSDIQYEASEACTLKLESLIGWKPTRTIEITIPLMIEFEKEQILKNSPPIVKKMESRGSVLITSASRKVPLIREMKKAAIRFHENLKVIAGDIDEMAISKFEADSFWKMPSISESTVDELINGCLSRGISVVLPTRDGELEFWAKHRDQFKKAGIFVIVSSPESIARCRDKIEFSNFGNKHNLPVIPASKEPEFFGNTSLVVKERYGAGSRGLGLDMNLIESLKHAANLEEPIFQPFIEGKEISIDGWVNRNGVVAGVVLRYRNRVISGESQVTTTFKNVVFEDQIKFFLSSLELNGPVVIQAIIKDEKLNIIECNPRFGGASTASISVGLDSLYWSLKEAFDGTEKFAFHRTSGEVQQIRVPIDQIIHVSDI
jgi:carbamoyl-phosphate synthase large subunit